MEPYIIHTERLGLRKWTEADIPPFVEMSADPDVMKFFPKTLTETETMDLMQRINTHFETHGFCYFAVEHRQTREFLGFTGLAIADFESPFTPCYEIGWRLKKEAWGKGYATEAARACLQYGFEELQFDKIFSWTATVNLNSEKVMQKIGMAKIGEFDHPKLAPDNWLCRHVLYEIRNNLII